jgi:hypothetical protein
VDLFQFNADFIAAAALGHNDDDVTELFTRAVQAGATVLDQRLTRTAGPEIAGQASFSNGAFEVSLDQAQYDAEFGDGTEPPKANVRRAIISASVQASREMSRTLSDG